MKESKAAVFRKRLAAAGPVLLAGAHNGLSAVLVERAGFDAIWASGFEISASFAVPDANILTMGENLAAAKAIDAASRLPVVADCDNGFGNAVNVIRTVREYEAAGIAAISIEDNVFPKRCSFYAGVRRELESIEEFTGKIRAAKDAQRTPEFAVIARTEALIAGWGMEEALKRARAYSDAGADLCLIHSKAKEPSEVIEFARRWDRKTPLVCVPTTYAKASADELYAAGFKVVIFANHGLRGAIRGMREALAAIKEGRRAAAAEPHIVALEEVYSLVGVDEMGRQEKQFLPAGGERAAAVILAAGDSASLGEGFEGVPKAMLDIKGKTILERQVAMLNSLGIKDIAVVRGHLAEKIDLPNIRYYDNPEYATTGELASLLRARAELRGRTVILYGDIIFERPALEKLLLAAADIAILVDRTFQEARGQLEGRAGIDRVAYAEPPPEGPRAIASEELPFVRRIGQNLPSDETHAEFVGLMMVTEAGARRLLEAADRAAHRFAGRPFYEARRFECAALTDLLQMLCDEDVPVRAVETFKGWMEIDSFEDYRRAWAALKG
jgi:phosphoenolpyruvate phosphomutase